MGAPGGVEEHCQWDVLCLSGPSKGDGGTPRTPPPRAFIYLNVNVSGSILPAPTGDLLLQEDGAMLCRGLWTLDFFLRTTRKQGLHHCAFTFFLYECSI